MASQQSYISTSIQNMSNNPNATIQQIIQMLGGYSNPAKDSYTPAEQREVTDPNLMTIAEYLKTLGAEGYTYEYDDFLSKLNAATNAGYDAQFNALDDAQSNYYRSLGAAQATAADTIRNQYGQAIQQGISKGMQSANMLSTLLGTSQAAAAEATQLAQDRYQTGQDLRAQLLKDAADAQTQSTNAYNTLLGNIRQLYNDDIQQKTADLEYNASVIDSNAQYAANKYTADTNYASGINTNASGIFNNNQSVLSAIMAAAAQAAAQDNYSDAYKAAAQEAAAAQRYAADQSAAAQRYAANQAYNNMNNNNTNNSNAPVVAYKPGSNTTSGSALVDRVLADKAKGTAANVPQNLYTNAFGVGALGTPSTGSTVKGGLTSGITKALSDTLKNTTPKSKSSTTGQPYKYLTLLNDPPKTKSPATGQPYKFFTLLNK